MARGIRRAVALLFATALAAQAEPAAAVRLRVVGRVLQADGTPVAAAQVHLLGLLHPELPPVAAWALGDSPLRIEGKCDDKGLFKLDLPHHGPFSLWATTDAGQRTRVRFPVMAGDFVAASLHPASRIAGVVLDASGQPVAGANVREASFSGAAVARQRHALVVPRAQCQTGADGRFALDAFDPDPAGLPLTSRSLQAWTASHSSQDRAYRLGGQSLADFALRLERPMRQAGRVTQEDGTPVPGARIVDVEQEQPVAVAGADGRFTIDNLDAATLLLRAPGRAIRALADARQGPGPLPAECELQRGAVVKARLLAADGPLAGRRVVLVTRDQAAASLHIAWQTTTDGEGRLLVDEARPGELLSGFVEFGDRFAPLLQLVPGPEPTDLGDVRVDGGRRLVGTVLGHDGARRGGAMVMLQSDQAPVPGAAADLTPMSRVLPTLPTRVTFTDQAGRFHFDGVPRTPQLCVVAAGLEGVDVVRVAADGDVGTIDWQHASAPSTCSGIVLLPDGRPAADVDIQYAATMDDAPTFGTVYLFGRTDAEGRFRIHRLPAHMMGSVWAMGVVDGQGYINSASRAGDHQGDLEVTLQPHRGRF